MSTSQPKKTSKPSNNDQPTEANPSPPDTPLQQYVMGQLTAEEYEKIIDNETGSAEVFLNSLNEQGNFVTRLAAWQMQASMKPKTKNSWSGR